MKNYYKRLLVEPDSKVKLKHFDPDTTGGIASQKAAEPEFQTCLEKIDKLHYQLYAERRHSVLIVLQGLDTAGKDGVIRHAFTSMNPQGCHVVSFKEPTAEEQGHDFLWRIHTHTPKKGFVSVFNRSHYESVLVERVHKLIPIKECSARYKHINEFERLLAIENNTTILKFFLHISKEEQLERFKQRLDDPARHWKISESDYTERDYWDDYMTAYEDLLCKTSIEYAPWFIIPANHKWFRDLAISQILVHAMERIKMKPPAPTVDIERIRQKYHETSTSTSTRRKK